MWKSDKIWDELNLSNNGHYQMKKSLSHLPQRKKGEPKERERFDLLRQAYVGARYHDDYKKQARN